MHLKIIIIITFITTMLSNAEASKYDKLENITFVGVYKLSEGKDKLIYYFKDNGTERKQIKVTAKEGAVTRLKQACLGGL